MGKLKKKDLYNKVKVYYFYSSIVQFPTLKIRHIHTILKHTAYCTHTQMHADLSNRWEVTVVTVLLNLRLVVAKSSGRQELLAPFHYYYYCCYCKPQ